MELRIRRTMCVQHWERRCQGVVPGGCAHDKSRKMRWMMAELPAMLWEVCSQSSSTSANSRQRFVCDSSIQKLSWGYCIFLICSRCAARNSFPKRTAKTIIHWSVLALTCCSSSLAYPDDFSPTDSCVRTSPRSLMMQVTVHLHSRPSSDFVHPTHLGLFVSRFCSCRRRLLSTPVGLFITFVKFCGALSVTCFHSVLTTKG